MREFLGLKLEVMFLSKYQLKKLNRKERQEYLTVKKKYIRFEEALKTGMIKHVENAHEFNKFQHEQDEHYLDDTYDKVINTNYSKIKKKEKKVDKIPVVRETPVVREERIVETNKGMKNFYPSTISLLYPIVAMIYIATKIPEVPVILGYGLSQLGYVMIFAGVYKGTFLVFNLDKRLQVFVSAIVCVGMGFMFINAK
tara:strand:- start:12 stop:605 length:594 start_codon:yes stop_codon:yes gene_type:complete